MYPGPQPLCYKKFEDREAALSHSNVVHQSLEFDPPLFIDPFSSGL